MIVWYVSLKNVYFYKQINKISTTKAYTVAIVIL